MGDTQFQKKNKKAIPITSVQFGNPPVTVCQSNLEETHFDKSKFADTGQKHYKPHINDLKPTNPPIHEQLMEHQLCANSTKLTEMSKWLLRLHP